MSAEIPKASDFLKQINKARDEKEKIMYLEQREQLVEILNEALNKAEIGIHLLLPFRPVSKLETELKGLGYELSPTTGFPTWLIFK